MALSRLQQSGMIRRLAQGLYEYPRTHPDLGVLPPNVEAVAKAMSEKNNTKLLATGAYAANLIGLTEQVPGKIIFLTNGGSKKIKIGNQEIIFKTARESTLHAAGTNVGLAIQALKNIGKNNADARVQKRIFSFLKDTPKKELKHYLKYAPQWIRVMLRALLEEESA